MKMNNKGFTLVEILAVIVILGIIMIVALPTYSNIYNNIRLTTHLNNIKTIRNAALNYGNNTAIKDTIKDLHDDSGNEWCKIISIDNLIQSGYLMSDNDDLNQITDVFTGEAMGFNLQNDYNSTIPKDGVALCYCEEKLDIEAFVVKDLAPGEVYHSGEVVRNYINDPSTYTSATEFEFRELKVSFIYNDLLKSLIKAKGKTNVTVEGKSYNISTLFDGVTGELNQNNEAFVKKVNNFIFENFTNKSTCIRNH